MKKFLLALMIGLFSVSAFAMHHEGKSPGTHKTAVHKKHKQHQQKKHKQHQQKKQQHQQHKQHKQHKQSGPKQ